MKIYSFIQITEKIKESIESGVLDVEYIDLKKALRTVNYNMLLIKTLF